MPNTDQLPVLEIKNLTKKIGSKTIVDNVNFNLHKGDVFGFLGPNGSGKTTTLRMITRLIFPTSGDVLIHGNSISMNYRKALSYIGSIIENPAFYLHMSAAKNLQLSARLSDKKIKTERIDEVLDLVKLTEAKNDKVRTFSLGMKQRLGFANALLCRPSIIILDEPTNGVDPMGLYEMKELVRHLSQNENITFLISSHMLREMDDLCNKVGIIQKGTLMESGDVKSLFSKCAVNSLEDLFFKLTEWRQL